MAKKVIKESTAFENEVRNTCRAYAVAGLATLEKTDPPTRSFYVPGRKEPRIIHLENPFLDFTGSWTEFGGKRLEIEVKVTNDPLLSIGTINPKTGKPVGCDGIKHHQLANALKWERYGAAVAFLWRFQNQTRLLTPSMVKAQLRFRKSLRWIDAHPVPQGPGFILIDFLALLRRIHKPTHTHTTP